MGIVLKPIHESQAIFKGHHPMEYFRWKVEGDQCDQIKIAKCL